MAITFKSVGHLFATFWQKAENALPKIEGTVTVVEGVSAAVPGAAGAGLLTAERAAYAVLGEVSAVLSAGSEAAKQKLADTGLDIRVLTTVETLLKSVPQIVALAEAL